MRKHPEFATAEGLVVKGSQGVKGMGVLLNTTEKAVSNSAQTAKASVRVESVANMKQVFEKNDFGRVLKKASIKTKFMDIKTNSQIYEVTEKLSQYGLSKGDKFYLDKFHGDHIEVFNKRNECIFVLNLDGTVNLIKSNKALNRPLKTK